MARTHARTHVRVEPAPVTVSLPSCVSARQRGYDDAVSLRTQAPLSMAHTLQYSQQMCWQLFYAKYAYYTHNNKYVVSYAYKHSNPTSLK